MSNRIFPRMVIKNNSNQEVGNLIFTYEDCKYPGGVRRVKQNDEKVVDIPNKHINYTTDLIMIHRNHCGDKKRYRIVENFNSNFNDEMNINIFAISNQGELDFSIE